jgi:hypothetical protein
MSKRPTRRRESIIIMIMDRCRPESGFRQTTSNPSAISRGLVLTLELSTRVALYGASVHTTLVPRPIRFPPWAH